MNFVGEWLGKFLFAGNQETNETNDSETNEAFIDGGNSITDKTTASDQRRQSSMIEGHLNSKATKKSERTLGTSVSDQRRLLGLFDGAFAKSSGKSEGPLRRLSTPCLDESIRKLEESKDKQTYIDGSGFDNSRIKSEPCGRKLLCWTQHNRKHSCRLRKFGKRANTPNLKRSTAINYLDMIKGNSNSKSSSSSRLDGSLGNEKRGHTCTIEDPSSIEGGEHESSKSSMKHNERSFIDIIRSNIQCLERNIALRHRRHNKRAKRQTLAEFYRNKYKTEASEPSKGTKSKEETLTNRKSKGVSRLFDFLRREMTTQDTRRTDSVRNRVATKLEKRKQRFEGQARVEVVAHFRRKYLNES